MVRSCSSWSHTHIVVLWFKWDVSETLGNNLLLLEEANEVQEEFGVQIEDVLSQPTKDGVRSTHIAMLDWSGFTHTVKGRANFGNARQRPDIREW